MLQKIDLVDSGGTVVAVAMVEDNGSHFSGTIDIGRMPDSMLNTFERYESLVNDQVLSLLDPLEERISAMAISAVFPDGRKSFAADLQVFPKARAISFKVISQRVPSSAT